ncbi:uncharacterized protein LAESUDRAFT_204018 [Laetiporus sulphureus 93-53]|uniref:Pentacotripeptide-repeat region of PRORP domain-containing protein n=1 Tax=Laetiporus sulphureus 93-53 TaxID=1314785 RepID=A0A165DYG7_9APHY|nr:uncharacterized protein LAESUDRAFT_204018 [Laetiporus sulphureus 93-53]KZT05878.1 hypothetical protein LAESUDRAFT_204018 [Laetiporus sulphureus 93-53]
MLARNASQRTTVSFIALDFLAPRIFCRGNATTRRTLKAEPVRPELNSSSFFDRSVVAPLASSSRSTLSPGDVLDQLNKHIDLLHGTQCQGLSNGEAEIFNQAVLQLRAMAKPLLAPDLHDTWRILNELDKRHLLRFFGPPHYEMCSRIVASYCKHKLEDALFDVTEMEALREISVAAAAEGQSEGLKQYMLSLIKLKNPDAVLLLYERYEALLGEKVIRLEPEEPVDGDKGESANSSSDHAQDTTIHGLQSDILLAAVTAHALRDSKESFLNAFSMSFRTSARFIPSVIDHFTRLLDHDEALAKRVKDYGRRIKVARLVARPAALAKHIDQLAHSWALKPLEELYQDISKGLSTPDPWLSVKSSDKDANGSIYVSESAWPAFITGFMFCRRTDLASNVWNDVLKWGIRPSAAMFTACIKGYGELNAPVEAINTWNAMLEQGLKPDIAAYQALVGALYHSNLPEEASKRFQLAKSVVRNLSPTPADSDVLVLYNTTLHGMLFHHEETEARAILDEMQAEGPKPDIVTFNTFLRYYARKGQLKTLSEILQMIEPTGLVGDVYTFSIVLSALFKVRDDAPEIVLNLMRKQGVEPNAATLTTIIDYQMRLQTEKGLHAALSLLGRMERDEIPGARPNDVTYTSILTGIHRSNWLPPKLVAEYRKIIWDKMKARKIKPKRTTFNILLQACFQNPEPQGTQDALSYYKIMQKERIALANDSWYILLHNLVKREEWVLANEVRLDLLSRNFTPAGALSDLVERVRKRATEKLKAGPAAYI